MNVGIIGYGSMGKMLADKFAASGNKDIGQVLVANRSKEKLNTVPPEIIICTDNRELAEKSDIALVCVRPVDMGDTIRAIAPVLSEDALLVSLNGSISFEMIRRITDRKTAKVIPSLTAEIDRSQTLVCYNEKVTDDDRKQLESLLGCIGNVIVLPEKEMGMGSELVSCMPGFIASIFDVLVRSAEEHTEIPHDQVVRMVLQTMIATGELMLKKDMSFEDVVTRVATPGGITEEGTKVVYENFPETARVLFEKTLQKRKLTAEKAEAQFE